MKYFFGIVLKSIKETKILQKNLLGNPVFRQVASIKSINKILEKQLGLYPFSRKVAVSKSINKLLKIQKNWKAL